MNFTNSNKKKGEYVPCFIRTGIAPLMEFFFFFSSLCYVFLLSFNINKIVIMNNKINCFRQFLFRANSF